MLKPSKKTLFAIEAVLDIAFNGGGEPVQSREITQRQGIPSRYLEQTLQALVRHGILVGVRGPRGGYRLARERRRISVGDIVRAAQIGDNPQEAEEPTSEAGARVIRPMWAALEASLGAQLDALSIESLCQRAAQAGIRSAAHNSLSWDI